MNSKMETRTLADVFNECGNVIDQQAYYVLKGDDSCRLSTMCRIYYALIDSHEGCNALGNNLALSMEEVRELLALGPRWREMYVDVRDYLFRLYLVSERIYEAMKVAGLFEPKYVLSTDGMRAIRDVKQWANFFKHPGAFLWCHEPEYYCLSLDSPPIEESFFIINQEVVNEFYASDCTKHAKLHKEISNKTCVQVHLPELVELTRRFCAGIDDFCSSISGPIFRDSLKKKSTIDDYFASNSYSCSSQLPE